MPRTWPRRWFTFVKPRTFAIPAPEAPKDRDDSRRVRAVPVAICHTNVTRTRLSLRWIRHIGATVRKRILVVDDDPGVVELICFNLEKAGFAVETAGDGVAGLKKARAKVPDAILLDLMTPELDGFSVCEMLRRDPATASIPSWWFRPPG